MWKKYCKISFLVLLTVLVVPCFFSCSDDSEDVVVNMNPPQYESVSGKYEITDSSSRSKVNRHFRVDENHRERATRRSISRSNVCICDTSVDATVL